MDGCTSCGSNGTAVGRLASPTRNRYYYGKLLDAYHFELEQVYHNRKRWLLNRLSVGTGVLCGLQISATADGRRITVSPGVALDGLGREIIVPAPSRAVDPTQPTDECGRPAGAPLLRGGVATVYLCFHECPAEPAPVLVDHCGPERECEFGIVEERYRVQIRPGRARPGELLPPEVCRRLLALTPGHSLVRLEAARIALVENDVSRFGEELNVLRARRGGPPVEVPDVEEARREAFDEERDFWLRGSTRRGLLCQLFGGTCPTPDDPCVAIATVTLDERGRVTAVDNCSVRRVIHSNAFLLELILCLAGRVDECCGERAVRAIEIVSGDNQIGVAGEPLAEPLVARVTENGQLLDGENVVFEVFGGGAIGENLDDLGPTFAVETEADGTATVPFWRLGPASGAQAVMARIGSGMPNQVTFRATAREQERLPVIRAVWPPNAVRLRPDGGTVEWFRQFIAEPRIELTFDRRMNEAQLTDPDPWLGVYAAIQRRDREQGGVLVLRLPAERVPPQAPSTLDVAGVTEVYRLQRVQDPETGEPVNVFAAAADGAVGATALVANVAATRAVRVIVLVRAVGGNIVAAAASGALLDAEFDGTLLGPERLEELAGMAVGDVRPFGMEVWDALVPGAVLQESGDGHEGGTFHSWFEFSQG